MWREKNDFYIIRCLYAGNFLWKNVLTIIAPVSEPSVYIPLIDMC